MDPSSDACLSLNVKDVESWQIDIGGCWVVEPSRQCTGVCDRYAQGDMRSELYKLWNHRVHGSERDNGH
jgi:hypothetical protein